MAIDFLGKERKFVKKENEEVKFHVPISEEEVFKKQMPPKALTQENHGDLSASFAEEDISDVDLMPSFWAQKNKKKFKIFLIFAIIAVSLLAGYYCLHYIIW